MKVYQKIQTMPEFEFLRDNLWVFTEKVDGTNIRIIWDGDRVTFAGKTDEAQIPSHLSNGQLYKSDSVDLVLFDVNIDGWWLERPVVPVIGRGTLLDAVEVELKNRKGFYMKYQVVTISITKKSPDGDFQESANSSFKLGSTPNESIAENFEMSSKTWTARESSPSDLGVDPNPEPFAAHVIDTVTNKSWIVQGGALAREALKTADGHLRECLSTLFDAQPRLLGEVSHKKSKKSRGNP